MDKLNEDEFANLYVLRTRHLPEFNELYEKATNSFLRILSGVELDSLEKTTFKEYAILRDIASLYPYIPYFDEEMLEHLSAEKIKQCQNIVDYFEKKVALLDNEFFIRLNQFVTIEIDIEQQHKPRMK